MQRFALALLMALCVGIVPFALADNGATALAAMVLLSLVLLLVRYIARTSG